MPQTGLDLQEQIARIDREQAQIHQLYAHYNQLNASHDRLRQEIWWQPLLSITAGMTAGAALFAAGAAFSQFVRL